MNSPADVASPPVHVEGNLEIEQSAGASCDATDAPRPMIGIMSATSCHIVQMDPGGARALSKVVTVGMCVGTEDIRRHDGMDGHRDKNTRRGRRKPSNGDNSNMHVLIRCQNLPPLGLWAKG